MDKLTYDKFNLVAMVYRTVIRPQLIELTASTETPIDDAVVRTLDFLLEFSKVQNKDY